MYLNFFNLEEEPFSMTPDPRFLYLSYQHEAALEGLAYGITHRKGFMTLTGEVGTGKTTICRSLLNRLPSNVEVALILNPVLSVPALIKSINRDFGCEIANDSVEEQLAALNEFLLERNKIGRNAVVLIDEAQNLSFEALEMIRLLSNLETETQKLLQIILVGQPELKEKLSAHRMRQLHQRISIRYQIGVLTFDEMKDYIFHRLFMAGEEVSLEFEKTALKTLYSSTEGYPRLINILCDRTLLAAYSQRLKTINKSVVKQAIRDVYGTH